MGEVMKPVYITKDDKIEPLNEEQQAIVDQFYEEVIRTFWGMMPNVSE